MDLRRIIPSDITASAIVHVSLLTLLLLFSEVHPFGAVTAEQIPVEIVTVQDLAEKQSPAEPAIAESKPEPTPSPQPDFSLLDKPAEASLPQPSPQPPQPSAQPQPAALAQMQAPPAAQRPSQPQPQAAAPAYQQPEPDLSIKYQVLLGLPPDLSPTLPAAPRKPAKRATTISMRRRPSRRISPAVWWRNSGGISRPARNCRRRFRAPTTSRSSCAC